MASPPVTWLSSSSLSSLEGALWGNQPICDLQLTRRLRGVCPEQAFLSICHSQEFFFQAVVLFAEVRGPAHPGKAMVFRSLRAIFSRVDHDILVRNFVRAGLGGTDTRQPLCFRDLEAAVLCFPVVKAPLADTLTTGCFHVFQLRVSWLINMPSSLDRDI